MIAALGLLITVLQLLAAESQEEDTIVTVQQGRLKGLRFESVRGQELLAFLGIPYASPPVAQLRFKVGFAYFLVLFSGIISTTNCAYRRVKQKNIHDMRDGWNTISCEVWATNDVK
jgi:hypothetical protein